MKSDFNDLFYNLVPGGFFTFVWYELLKPYHHIGEFVQNNSNSEGLLLLLFLIFSFMVGFSFHSIWSILKNWTNFECLLFFCCNRDLKDSFDKQNKKIKSVNQIRFAHFFSDRAAYWMNFGLGFIITLAIYLIYNDTVKSIWIILILTAIIFSFYCYYHYRQKEIGTVMK